MFEVLVESGERRSAEVGPGAAALSLHVVLVLAAGLGPRAVPGVVPRPVVVPIAVFGPALPQPTGGAPVGSPVPGVDAAPALPEVPVAVPAGLPPVSLPPLRGDTLWSPNRVMMRDLLGQGGPARRDEGSAVRLAGEVDEQARVVAGRQPVYPAALAAVGMEGQVRVEFVVDTLGRCEPGSVRVVSSSHAGFEDAAVEAVLGSTYRPARAKGRAVRQLVYQRMVFRVE